MTDAASNAEQSDYAGGAPSITVVIPTYNERENIQTLIPAVLALGDG